METKKINYGLIYFSAIILTLIAGIIGGKVGGLNNKNNIESSKGAEVTLIRAFKNTGNWDSVYLYSDGHLNIVEKPIDSTRYFLVSYRWNPPNSNAEYYGRIVEAVKGGGFVNETELIKRISDFWPKNNLSKGNKDVPIIENIFEFRDSMDFKTFRK